jgi:hypothetical protein
VGSVGSAPVNGRRRAHLERIAFCHHTTIEPSIACPFPLSLFRAAYQQPGEHPQYHGGHEDIPAQSGSHTPGTALSRTKQPESHRGQPHSNLAAFEIKSVLCE